MTSSNISLIDVNLHYSSAAYKERSIKSLVTSFLKPKSKRTEVKDIHALRNVSLTISKGERVGILGHNGAGKSTFLKTIAELYPISSGKVVVEGQIRSLFDLSLGFEPDATGRENILYRGLLLGLTPSYMRQKEQEIIDFAQLGEFIDYPIKAYSAGMQVRLAFSISTSVGGDILLLDEVIGAGDASFMIKAKQRMQELVEKSEILVLASHDFSSLKSICQRGILFHHGEVVYDGNIDAAIAEYNRINKIGI